MRIAFLGDIAFYGKYSVENNKRVFDYFREIKEYLSTFDYVIGNLETPFCHGLKPRSGKSASISSLPENIELLNYLNINVVNLANNHIFDYSNRGYNETIKILRSNDIKFFGVNDEELLIRTNSASLAFHGYCSYNTNPLGMMKKGKEGVTPLNISNIVKKISALNDEMYLNIVSIHSGQEHVNYPSRDDIKMARILSKICPYVYYGHHPHVVQGAELINGSVIAYSLGNFCFDDVYTSKSINPLIKQNDNNKTGLILELSIEENHVLDQKFTSIFLDENTIKIDRSIDRVNFEEYSSALQLSENKYHKKRQEIINKYIDDRKRMRNIEWYIKRLNLNSVKIIINSKINGFKYKKSISDWI